MLFKPKRKPHIRQETENSSIRSYYWDLYNDTVGMTIGISALPSSPATIPTHFTDGLGPHIPVPPLHRPTASLSCASMSLLSLPPEVITEILQNLPFSSLLHVRLTCTTLKDSVEADVGLAYIFICHKNGIIPTNSSRAPFPELIQAVHTKARSWMDVTLEFTLGKPIPFPPSGIYDLVGGVFLLGTADRNAVMTFRVPESKEAAQENNWNVLRIVHQYVDIALNIVEHNLIAMLAM